MLWLATLLLFASAVNANKWVVSVETAKDWMAGYAGDVTFCFTYRPVVALNVPEDDELLSNDTTTVIPVLPKREECQSLPSNRFLRGMTYLFELELSNVVDTLEEVRVFGKPASTSVCKRKGALDSWHVNDLSFHDMITGRLFRVQGRLSIETRCSAANEAILNHFNVSIQPRPCPMDGVIYRSGDRFNDRCSGSCQCRDGGLSCVSMCPPSGAPGCREIYVPGECCQRHICENKKPYNSVKACPIYEEGDCEMANRTVGAGEYPWTVFIKLCDKNECKKFCSGALINERWIITAGDCVRSVSNITRDIRVIVGENAIVLGEDSDVEIGVDKVVFSNAKTQSEQLALIQLSDSVAFDQTVQPATLPVSRSQCQSLTRSKCAASMTGWVNVDLESQQYELYQVNVNLLDLAECESSTANNTSGFGGFRKRKPLPPSAVRGMCVDLSNDEISSNPECGNCQSTSGNNATIGCHSDKNLYLCTGERGRVVISKLPVATPYDDDFLEVNYMVGMVAYQLTAGETPLDLCKKPAFKLAVHICNDIEWINYVTTLN